MRGVLRALLVSWWCLRNADFVHRVPTIHIALILRYLVVLKMLKKFMLNWIECNLL